MNGPTLNPEYNRVLASWKDGTKPHCENCGCDLTGKDVVGCDCWRCSKCAAEYADEHGETERPDRSNSLSYVGGGYAVDSRGHYREAFWAGSP